MGIKSRTNIFNCGTIPLDDSGNDEDNDDDEEDDNNDGDLHARYLVECLWQ